MNILSYQSLESHGLSFEILVDGEPIGKKIGSSGTSVPYWLFKTGVALHPLNRIGTDMEKRVVAVCSCGEYGCSSMSCNIVRSWDDNIVFRDFERVPFSSNPFFDPSLFYFSPINYDSVISEIFEEIHKFRIG
jgi:hypothetical protein